MNYFRYFLKFDTVHRKSNDNSIVYNSRFMSKAIINFRKVHQLTGHNAAIFALSQQENDRFLLSGAGDGWVARWDLSDPEMGQLIAKTESRIFSLHYLPKLNTIIAGNMDGGVHWINVEEEDGTRNVLHHRKGVGNGLRLHALGRVNHQ